MNVLRDEDHSARTSTGSTSLEDVAHHADAIILCRCLLFGSSVQRPDSAHVQNPTSRILWTLPSLLFGSSMQRQDSAHLKNKFNERNPLVAPDN
eukprot:CAMPEP_0194484734 /NCGR_PEP_ID=MMETSP0253-20130528/5979_1 /TAXON_ID=2966 /ORGANISM="Noctiluca scintillans" /LENGTH=93 /DNA_ID=CAMNT_0039324599 /DNA_START=44 /DNA_END=328 /DNA_ORIENTATION=+